MALGEQHLQVSLSGPRLPVRQDRHRYRCGSWSTGSSTCGVDGCRDIGHIRVEEFGPTCACGNTGCLEAFFGGAALARDALAAARSQRLPVLAALLAEKGELTAVDVASAVAQWATRTPFK